MAVIPASEMVHLEKETVYLKLARIRIEALAPVQAQGD
jgi:hypothetical protein